MNLRQIEMFRAIMATGSFTAAAQALFISQSGVSRAARHLEIQLGVPLFERTQGRIRPTDEALALQVEIERSYQGVQSIQQFASGLRHGTYALLRVACSPNVGSRVVPDAIAALLGQNAKAGVSFDVLHRAQQFLDALMTQQVDLAIAAVALEHPTIEVTPLGQWELVCVLPPDHRLAAKASVSPADLAGESLVAFHPDTVQGRELDSWFAPQDKPYATRAIVRSGQGAVSLVASGVGIAFVDNLTAQAAAQAHGLVWRPLPQRRRFPIQAAWNRHHAPSQQALRLCRLVQQALQKAEAEARPKARRAR